MTGARASAMCLCVNGLIAQNKAYSIGNTTISCDIGGSSTDIAISRVWGPAVLKRFCQLELKPSGFTTVQRAFFLHVAQTLTRAGAHRPNDLAPKLVCDEGTVKILHGFTDKQHKDRVKLSYPASVLWKAGHRPHRQARRRHVSRVSWSIFTSKSFFASHLRWLFF